MSQVFSTTALIELAIAKQVLKFGSFTLKSGRVSPYFFNAGLLDDGHSINLLAAGYAAVLASQQVDVVFGPAYKGIALCAATADAMYRNHNSNVAWGYNRKEEKSHGEGGNMVGASVSGKRVWIVDDVITAGTAIREVITLLQQQGAIVAGIVVALDRQEKGQGALSAIGELQQEYNIPVHALITLDHLIAYVEQQGQHAQLASMRDYRAQYGIA